jgi:hypothetical protein
MFWPPLGFPVITAFPYRAKVTATYFWSDIIPKRAEGIPFGLANSPRHLMLYMNNNSIYRARESIAYLKKFRIRPIGHSPDPRDLAPSDFHLFGKLKSASAGQVFQSTEELILAIMTVTGSIGWAEVESVFEDWKRRLSEWIQSKDECVAYNESKVLTKIHILIARLRCQRVTGDPICV